MVSFLILLQGLNYCEDPIVRHMEPPLTFHLNLDRLANFEIRLVLTTHNLVHVYEAKPLDPPPARPGRRGGTGKRFFVRALVRDAGAISTMVKRADGVLPLDAHPGPERSFVDALDALEMAVAEETCKGGYVFFAVVSLRIPFVLGN